MLHLHFRQCREELIHVTCPHYSPPLRKQNHYTYKQLILWSVALSITLTAFWYRLCWSNSVGNWWILSSGEEIDWKWCNLHYTKYGLSHTHVQALSGVSYIQQCYLALCSTKQDTAIQLVEMRAMSNCTVITLCSNITMLPLRTHSKHANIRYTWICAFNKWYTHTCI